MELLAEIIEVKSRKTASLDIEYTIRLRTNDPNALTLGAISPDELVKVKVSPEHGKA